MASPCPAAQDERQKTPQQVKRDFRRWVRAVEYNDSMAAASLWRAAVETAKVGVQGLQVRLVLRHLADARWWIARNTYPACALVQHRGIEREFQDTRPEQLRLIGEIDCEQDG
jgi:hypothetical protein